MEMDEGYEGKNVLCNVFYLKGSPASKKMVEDRTVKLPTSDPRYSGELKYKAYHLSLVTIDMMIKKKLPFLLPFIVQSELQGIKDGDTPIRHIDNIRQQIDDNEYALTEMINGITDDQLESLRTMIAYLWERSYSDEVFNKSTLLKLMREQLNLRQDDVQSGFAAGRATGITTGITTERTRRIASEKAVANRMVEQGKLTREQMDYFLKEMENYKNYK